MVIKDITKPNPVYLFHGSDAKLLDRGLKSGTYFTTDLEVALKYGKTIYIVKYEEVERIITPVTSAGDLDEYVTHNFLSLSSEDALNFINNPNYMLFDTTLPFWAKDEIAKGHEVLFLVYVKKAKPLLVYDYRYKKGFITNRIWKDDFLNGTIAFGFICKRADMIARAINVYNEVLPDVNIYYHKDRVLFQKVDIEKYLKDKQVSYEKVVELTSNKIIFMGHTELVYLDTELKLTDFCRDYDVMDTDEYGNQVKEYKQPISIFKQAPRRVATGFSITDLVYHKIGGK